MKRRLLPLALVPALLAACTVHDAGRPRRSDAVRGEDVPPPSYVGCPPERPRAPDPALATPTPPRPPAEVPGRIHRTPSIRVVGEALAVELERSTGSERGVKYSRDLVEGLPGTKADVDFEAVLLNASFTATAAQDAENRGQKAVGRVARVADADMNDLLAALDK